MVEKKLAHQSMKISMNDTIQKVLDILEMDDGRSFNEKKQEVIDYLTTKGNTLLAEKILQAAINDEIGKELKEKFRNGGAITRSDKNILIRPVKETDKEKFIDLQKETFIIKSMLKEEACQTMLWKEHIQDKSMMFTIEANGAYAGYCGISNLSQDNWEIAIELFEEFRNKGVGYTALNIMLSEIRSRLGVSCNS